MAKPIYVLNGPNLNRLGTREPQIYGSTTIAQVEAMCREARRRRADRVPAIEPRSTRSSIGFTKRSTEGSAIIINPAAYTFTSMAIMDALKMFPGPIIELHISNIHKREPIYHKSLMSAVATAVIAGLGPNGYPTAVQGHPRAGRGVGRAEERLKAMAREDASTPSVLVGLVGAGDPGLANAVACMSAKGRRTGPSLHVSADRSRSAGDRRRRAAGDPHRRPALRLCRTEHHPSVQAGGDAVSRRDVGRGGDLARGQYGRLQGRPPRRAQHRPVGLRRKFQARNGGRAPGPCRAVRGRRRRCGGGLRAAAAWASESSSSSTRTKRAQTIWRRTCARPSAPARGPQPKCRRRWTAPTGS